MPQTANKKVFLICPVRHASNDTKELIASYVVRLENEGHDVHWPARDTEQNDPVGLHICETNRLKLEEADEIHVWYDETSIGSVFDFGMAFALRKKLVLANPSAIKPTPHKSFANVLLILAGRTA